MIYHVKGNPKNIVIIFRISIQSIMFLNKLLNEIKKNY